MFFADGIPVKIGLDDRSLNNCANLSLFWFFDCFRNRFSNGFRGSFNNCFSNDRFCNNRFCNGLGFNYHLFGNRRYLSGNFICFNNRISGLVHVCIDFFRIHSICFVVTEFRQPGLTKFDFQESR